MLKEEKTLKIKRVNLSEPNERKKYSTQLQRLESQFHYPLGNTFFKIQHGLHSDYFAFFEQFDTPYFYVFEKNDETIGCICFILREINDQKIWYICDLKIAKAHRDRTILFKFYKLLNKTLKKICPYFYFINMSPEQNNGFLSLARKILFGFQIQTKPLYFFQTSGNQFLEKQSSYLTNATLINNQGIKDIIIDGEAIKLHHITPNTLLNHYRRFNESTLSHIDSSDQIMFCSFNKTYLGEYQHNIDLDNEGVIVSNHIDLFNDHFSTFEI